MAEILFEDESLDAEIYRHHVFEVVLPTGKKRNLSFVLPVVTPAGSPPPPELDTLWIKCKTEADADKAIERVQAQYPKVVISKWR